jgi:1-phosphofructokinase family hexose kinase
MILTVTPNPALDYTIRVDALELGRRARYRDPAIDPAGKGINVARMVRRLGEATLALGFAAGATGELLKERLDAEGIPHDLVPVAGLTRINVTLLTGPEGSATHLHGAGSGVSREDVERLLDKIEARLSEARLLVYSGSLPPGMDPGVVADLVGRARGRRVKAIIDAEGEALAAAVRAKADLVKPNVLEAAEFLGRPLSGERDAAEAAREIVGRGVGACVITLRGEGAVAAAGKRAWQVRAPREEVVRSIGAGDSFAAGLAIGLLRGEELSEALRLGAAAGAATARRPGTGLGALAEVRRLRDETELREL